MSLIIARVSSHQNALLDETNFRLETFQCASTQMGDDSLLRASTIAYIHIYKATKAFIYDLFTSSKIISYFDGSYS